MANSAQAQIKATLDQYGLGSLAGWVWNQYLKSGASDVSTFMAILQPKLEQRPEYQTRFPGMKALQDKGLAITPQQYVQQESTYLSALRGLTPGMFDTTEFLGKLIANQVSPSEVQERVQNAQAAIYNASPEVRTQINALYHVGASTGDITSYFLDPDRAEPLLNRSLAAAKISAAGVDSGYGALNVTEAERAAQQGLTDDAVQQGFQTLVHDQDTFNPQIGAHDLNQQGVTRDQQLGAVFGGNAADQELIQREQSTRKAAFSDGGQFATDKTGVSGLGTAAV